MGAKLNSGFCLFLLFLVAVPQMAFAQKRYLFRNFTVADGLPHNTIYGINQDKNGFLWIASDGGISRFDGTKFDNTVTPQVNKAQAFCQYVDKSPSGKLAFATFMEGVVVVQENGREKQYLRKKKQLGKNVVRTLKWVSDTSLLFSESRNINSIENDSIRQIYDQGKNGNLFQSLEYDKSGNIWFGGISGVGVIFAGADSVKPFFLPEFKDIYVIKLRFINNNTLLVGAKTGYYQIDFQGLNERMANYKISQPHPELNGKYINDIYPDRDNNIWISSSASGIYQIRNHKITRHITSENGLPADGAMCVFQDNEQNYWIGTTNGLCRLYSFTTYSYSHNKTRISNITNFAKDQWGRIWLYNDMAFYLVENEMVRNEDLRNTVFANNPVLDFGFSNNIGYFFTEKGMYSLPATKALDWAKTQKEIDFKQHNIDDLKCHFFDSDGKLWLGYDGGISVVENKKIGKVTVLSDTNLRLRPNNILQDHYGHFWMGDFTYGLHCFENIAANGTPTLKLLRSYESLKPDSAFATAWIQDMLMDKNGNIWLSSLFTGVYKLTINKSGVTDARLFSSLNGLSSNDVTQVKEGTDGSIWFATRNGVDRLIFSKNGDEKMIHYNDKNGLGRYAFEILPDDSVSYLSFEEGFFVVDNSLAERAQNDTLHVRITQVSLMGKADSAALNQNHKKYRLPHHQNFISFDFLTVRLKDNEGIEYRYKLDGLEKDWSTFSNRRFAGYNSLAPGNYSFMVQAKMVNNETIQPVTSFQFQVKQAFYNTWWFYSLLLLFLAGAAFLLYRYRIRQLIQLQKLRSKIASDLHDDVGSTLSSISILSDILQSQSNNPATTSEMIRKIGSNAHDMLESMDDIIWSVNPANDKFRNLALRIREYAIPLFESKNIDFEIITPDSIDALSLTMEIRRTLFLIVKEAVNNLVKYAECSRALVDFSYKNGLLNLIIQDNGKGFDLNGQNGNRNGLKNMKQRAEQIGASLKINSKNGEGTQIILSVKTI